MVKRSASTHARPLSVVAGALLAEYAIRVFDKICEHGITPNLKTFETLIWGFAKAKQPWKAEETLQIMTEFEVQREKSTMLLVTEAWRATGMTQEASGTLGTINKIEMSCQKETGKTNTGWKNCIESKQQVSSIPISCRTQVQKRQYGAEMISRVCSWLATRTCRFLIAVNLGPAIHY